MNEKDFDRYMKRAERQYKLLSNEGRETLKSVRDLLRSRGLQVNELASAWMIVSCAEKPYMVQLECEAVGLNLDMALVMEGDEHAYPRAGGFGGTSYTKLTYGNENFSVERVLSFFGMHETSVGDESIDPVDDHQRQNNDHVYQNIANEYESRLRLA